MDDPTRPPRLTRKLNRYAGTHVPATLDLWPAIRQTLLTAAPQSGIFNSGGAILPPFRLPCAPAPSMKRMEL